MSQTTTFRQDHTELTVLFVGSPTVDLETACGPESVRPVDIEVVTDGWAALQRLITASESPATHTRPDLVLLQCDFELPDGMIISHAIKSSLHLNTMPVAIIEPDGAGVELIYDTD